MIECYPFCPIDCPGHDCGCLNPSHSYRCRFACKCRRCKERIDYNSRHNNNCVERGSRCSKVSGHYIYHAWCCTSRKRGWII